MSLLPTLAFLGLLVLMAEASGVQSSYSSSCGCSSYDQYEVCGEDSSTYSSACYAQCAGVRVRHVGRCQTYSSYGGYRGDYRGDYRGGYRGDYRGDYRSGCNCGQVSYSPVCCDNHATYDNYCLAGCAGRRVVYAGQCRTAAGYQAGYPAGPQARYPAGPQAGYPAGHQAGYQAGYPAGYQAGYPAGYPGGYRAGQPVYSDTYHRTAACDVKCSAHNDRYPVCCSDYRTYQNACQARCAGAHIFYYGRCDRQVYYSKNYGQCGNCYGQARNFVCGGNGRTYYNQCFCDCASSDYSSYKKIGLRHTGYCSGFNYQSSYY